MNNFWTIYYKSCHSHNNTLTLSCDKKDVGLSNAKRRGKKECKLADTSEKMVATVAIYLVLMDFMPSHMYELPPHPQRSDAVK